MCVNRIPKATSLSVVIHIRSNAILFNRVHLVMVALKGDIYEGKKEEEEEEETYV
mgnify:CR=1 FL=1